MFRRILVCIVSLLAWVRLPAKAEAVEFRPVWTTLCQGNAEHLQPIYSVNNTSARGWSLPEGCAEPQTAIFSTTNPVEANLLQLSFFFFSGRPDSSFARFALSYTTDSNPSLKGTWHPVSAIICEASSCKLQYLGNGEFSVEEKPNCFSGTVLDSLYSIVARVPTVPITAFRLDVFPVFRAEDSGKATPLMAWARDGVFVLTGIRAEIVSCSTNAALGAAVTANGPLFEKMEPGLLTDGWPATIAHPDTNQLQKDFFFEIDLGKVRRWDHFVLRQRGEPHGLNRFALMRLRMYDADPKSGVPPVWQVLVRPDGSYPDVGEADTLRAGDGQGQFHGRYVRISTDGTVKGAPQLAEFEAYETRTPQLLSVEADGRKIDAGSHWVIPSGVHRLAFQFALPGEGKPLSGLFRWRLRGNDKEWEISKTLSLAIVCPPAGNYTLEVQAAHSDGAWDATALAIPLVIQQPFTQSWLFLFTVLAGTISLSGLAVYFVLRTQFIALKLKNVLELERTRIAQDMHDDVGARLSQLSVMQETLATQNTVSEEVRDELKKLALASRQTVSAVQEVVWIINPKHDTLEGLVDFLIRHADSYLSAVEIPCRFKTPSVLPSITIHSTVRHEISMVFKEALQNVVKHARATEVLVTLSLDGTSLMIMVADNGIGMGSVSHRGNGLKNMHQRLSVVRGSCQVHARADRGTEVVFRVPFYPTDSLPK